MTGLFVALFLLFLVMTVIKVKFAKRRYSSMKLENNPLAGLDTGARSPYRVPKGVRHSKRL